MQIFDRLQEAKKNLKRLGTLFEETIPKNLKNREGNRLEFTEKFKKF